MAAFRHNAPQLPAGELRRAPPLGERVFRGGDGELRERRPARPLLLAHLWRRAPLSIHGAPGCRRLLWLSAAHAGAHRYSVRMELWDPFLNHFGDWDRQK